MNKKEEERHWINIAVNGTDSRRYYKHSILFLSFCQTELIRQWKGSSAVPTWQQSTRLFSCSWIHEEPFAPELHSWVLSRTGQSPTYPRALTHFFCIFRGCPKATTPNLQAEKALPLARLTGIIDHKPGLSTVPTKRKCSVLVAWNNN